MADYLSDYQRLRCRRNLLNDRIRATENRVEELRQELNQNQRDTREYERVFVSQHSDLEYDEMCTLAEHEAVQFHHIDSYDLWLGYQPGHEPEEVYASEEARMAYAEWMRQEELGVTRDVEDNSGDRPEAYAPPPLSSQQLEDARRLLSQFDFSDGTE